MSQHNFCIILQKMKFETMKEFPLKIVIENIEKLSINKAPISYKAKVTKICYSPV